jgi:hypothetical protein
MIAVACGCASEPSAQLTVVSSTPELGTPLAGPRDIEIIFDYEVLPRGLQNGGVLADSVRFDGTGRITWADGTTGNARPFFREPTEIPLGSEVTGRGIRWVYPEDDLRALMSHASQPRLDDRGDPIPVRIVELVGSLRWTYGCAEHAEVGTSSCPANLGHHQPLGELIF